MRAAAILDPAGVKGRLLALIDAHACHAARALVSSPYLVDAEIVALPDAGHPRELSQFLTQTDLNGRLELHDDSLWQHLPPQCPAGGVDFGEGDRRWVACTEAASVLLDEDALLATDDEDLIANMLHCVESNLTVTMPVHSTAMFLKLWGCGALQVDELEAMLDAEEIRLSEDVVMGSNKRARKQERLAKVASQLGFLSA